MATITHPHRRQVSGREIPVGTTPGTVAAGEHSHAQPIDGAQTPVAETITPTHTIVVTIGGVDYKLAVVAA
jgi:hypothetical protein